MISYYQFACCPGTKFARLRESFFACYVAP